MTRPAKKAQAIDGYTPEQRFFLGFGRVVVRKAASGISRMLVQYRSPFARTSIGWTAWSRTCPSSRRAWGCKAGQPMVRENACRVW